MDLTDITSVTFTGSADLSLLVAGNGFTEITSITGTAATGGLTIDLDDNAAAYTINLGAGDDSIVADQANTGTGGRTINMGAGNDTLDLGALGSESDDVFNGGAGTDTLIIRDASDITVANTVGVTGFERLIGTEAATYDMSAFANGSDFTIVRATAAGTNIVFDNVRDTVTTLELSGNSDNVTLTRLVDGTANAITIAAVAATTIDAEVIVDQEETVTINAGTASLTLTTGLSADDMTAMVVVGDNAVDLSAVSSTLLRTVDLSGFSDANFTAEFTAATNSITITANTSAGNSGAYNIQLGQSDDVVVGTANADTFDGNGGNDTFTLGGGRDTVIIDGQGIDTITDFVVGATGDIISIDISAIGAVIGGDGANEADGVAVSVELVTGQETLAAGDNVIVLSGTTFASAALAGAALEAGGARQITFGGATTAGDDIIFVFSDGTDAFVVAGNIGSAATTITAGNLTETVLVKWEGVSHTDLADLTSDNFILA